MSTVVRSIGPVATVFALATAVGILIAQEGPVLAILGAASVLLVGVIAEIVARRVVRQVPPPAAPTVAAPAYWYYPLTKRQSEVAVLLADPAGLSNKEIADRLFIGERGVEATVQNIFNKLSEHTAREFHNRTQVALWVKERMAEHPPEPPKPPAPRTVPR